MMAAGKPAIKKAEREPHMPSDSLSLRVISSLVLVPVALGAVYAGGWLFCVLVALACLVMTFEWTRMVQRRSYTPAFYVLAVAAAVALAAAGYGQFGIAFALAGGGAAAALVVSRSEGVWEGAWKIWPSIAVPYIIIPSIALIWLRTDLENGRFLTFLLFASVWAGDIGAYSFGKTIGGPKVNPALSPAKTWAGIGGGIFMGGVAAAVAGALFFGMDALLPYFLIGGCLGGASVFGDMVESGLKRHFDIKDVSDIIPGHGGALDRMDGMIFATMAMTAAIFLYMVSGRF